jgi:hypothetical protein
MFKFFFLIVGLLLFSFNFFAQDLHHQMISSQGTSKTISSGLIVKQTIGQQTVSGNIKGDIIVQQGFQQSYWEDRIIESNSSQIIVSAYPNPFIDVINFQFSEFPGVSIEANLFDINGRLVFRKSLVVVDNLLTINLLNLPNAQYLVLLSNEKLNYFTKIIKKD